MRGEPHHVLEVVRDEDERHLAASGAARRSRPGDGDARRGRRRRTARRAAAPPARGPALAPARLAGARRLRARVAGARARPDRCTSRQQRSRRGPGVRRAGDAQAPSSRCRPPSGAETTRIPGRRIRRPGDAAARTSRVPVSIHVSAARSDRGLGRPIEPGDRAKNRRLAAAGRPEDREHVARIARELDVERNRTRLTEPDRQARGQPRRGPTRRDSAVVAISVATAMTRSVAAMTPALRSSKACMRS